SGAEGGAVPDSASRRLPVLGRDPARRRGARHVRLLGVAGRAPRPILPVVKLVLAFVFVAAAVGATTSGNRIPTVGCDTHIDIPNEPPPPQDALVLGRVEMPRPGD